MLLIIVISSSLRDLKLYVVILGVVVIAMLIALIMPKKCLDMHCQCTCADETFCSRIHISYGLSHPDFLLLKFLVCGFYYHDCPNNF